MVGRRVAHELVGGQVGQGQGLAEALVGHLRGQGAAPAGIGRGQDQCPWDLGVAAVEGQGQGAAEGDAGQVWGAQAESGDEAGQGVGVAGHAERLGGVGGAAGPGGVPGDQGEVVAEPVELGAPGGGAVAHEAVEQDERGTAPGTLVGDAESFDLDRFHLRGYLPGWMSSRPFR